MATSLDTVIQELVRLQQVLRGLPKRADDKDRLACAALAAATLAQDLLALNEEARHCAGTYWKLENDKTRREPHSACNMDQNYVGPMRESGESTALCNSCGRAYTRTKKKHRV